jgi:hypothetical protein
MSSFQLALAASLFVYLGYLAGQLREARRWAKGGVRRIKTYGSYYWIIPDDDEVSKRFIAQAFSAPALWSDSVEYDTSSSVSGTTAVAMVGQILGSDPHYRFDYGVGWHLGEYWIVLYTFDTGEYYLQLQRDRIPIATAVSRVLCLKDATEWIFHTMKYPSSQIKAHYIFPAN